MRYNFPVIDCKLLKRTNYTAHLTQTHENGQMVCSRQCCVMLLTTLETSCQGDTGWFLTVTWIQIGLRI